MYEIAVMIKICNFPFEKPSSAAGNSYTSHMFKGICFTALVVNCESVFYLRFSEQVGTIPFHFFGEEVRNTSRK